MDINAYFDRLDRQQAEAIELAQRFPKEQLAQRPETGCWSPLEVLEHIWLTEAMLLKVLSRPSEQLSETMERIGDTKLEKLVVAGRAYKLEAPERLRPSGSWKTLADFETQFGALRKELRAALESGTIGIDNRMHPHPVLGDLTITDWLHFLVHHTQRHLEELRARTAQPAIGGTLS